MDRQFEVRQKFDESFKRKVIEEYLATGCSMRGLLRKYNILSQGAIYDWMRRLGYTDSHKPQKINFARITALALPNKSSDIENEDSLRKQIKALERQLEDEKLRSEAYNRIIDKAEKELKIPIRKKPNTK